LVFFCCFKFKKIKKIKIKNKQKEGHWLTPYTNQIRGQGQGQG
jgi:hypothetical protein